MREEAATTHIQLHDTNSYKITHSSASIQTQKNPPTVKSTEKRERVFTVTRKQLRQEIPPTWFIYWKTCHDTSENLQDLRCTSVKMFAFPVGHDLFLHQHHEDKIHVSFSVFALVSEFTQTPIMKHIHHTKRWWREKYCKTKSVRSVGL